MSLSDSQFTQVTPDELPQVWPLIQWHMNSFASRSEGRFQAEDYYSKIQENYMQCWLSIRSQEIEACGLTEIVVYPRKKMLRICGGTGQNRKNWQVFEEYFAIWAKANGCDGLESIQRKGWFRFFKTLGYKQTHIFVERML